MIVKQFLDAGKIDPDPHGNKATSSILFAAAARGCTELFRHIITMGQIDLTLKNDFGWTLQWIVAFNGHSDLAKVLLGAGTSHKSQCAQEHERSLV